MDNKLNQMWKFLDDLAANDPVAYRQYITKMKKESQFSGRIIRPGYYVKAKAQGQEATHHYLNVCRSKAVAACTDNFNIPTLMSEKRKILNTDGSTDFVYDAVFHDSIFERSDIETGILDLALGCVLELFKVNLIKSSFEIVKDDYYGKYGWNDKIGKPLTDQEWLASLQTPDDIQSLKEAQDLLFGKSNPAVPTVAPEIITRADQAQSTDNEEFKVIGLDSTPPNPGKPLIEEIETKPAKPLIEEIPSPLISVVSPVENTASEWIKPDFSLKQQDNRIDITVILPEIKSSEEIEYRHVTGTEFEIKAGGRYMLNYSLPSAFDCDSAQCKFVRSKSKLKLSFSKIAQAAII